MLRKIKFARLKTKIMEKKDFAHLSEEEKLDNVQFVLNALNCCGLNEVEVMHFKMLGSTGKELMQREALVVDAEVSKKKKNEVA